MGMLIVRKIMNINVAKIFIFIELEYIISYNTPPY